MRTFIIYCNIYIFIIWFLFQNDDNSEKSNSPEPMSKYIINSLITKFR